MRRKSMRFALLVVSLLAFAVGADAAVLDRARDTGELRIGYRPDAQPFSLQEDRRQGRAATASICVAR